MDVEATTAVRPAEIEAAKRMIERTQSASAIWPQRLAADMSYRSAKTLAWVVHERF